MVEIGKRLVFEYASGSASFRHLNDAASLQDIFDFAKAFNSFQDESAQRVLLVTTSMF